MAKQIGQIQKCSKCGVDVVRAVGKSGKPYTAEIIYWNGSDAYSNAERRFFPCHKCVPNPEYMEAQEIAQQDAIARGEMVKGQTVIVVRGRKVPKGTTGELFWIANSEDEWGVLKAGIITQDGDKVFVNHEYLEVLVDQI